MIDLHNHILFGADDGAIDLTESLEIARVFADEGVVQVAATPHYDPLRHHGITADVVRERVAHLKSALDEEGINLAVVPGNELLLTPNAPELYRDGKVSPLGSGPAVLVEVPFEQPATYRDDTLFRLLADGLQPVLAHPERYRFVQDDKEAAIRIADRGVVLQVTAPALLGEYGGRVRDTAEWLVRHGVCHVAASDRHHPQQRRSLRDVYRRITELVDEATAELMLRTNPARLLAGKDTLPPHIPQEEQPPRFVGRLLGRRR